MRPIAATSPECTAGPWYVADTCVDCSFCIFGADDLLPENIGGVDAPQMLAETAANAPLSAAAPVVFKHAISNAYGKLL